QPLVFAAVRRIVREPRYANVVLLAIVLALAVVAGHPESTLHVVALGVAFGAFTLFAPGGGGAVKAILAATVAGILALALSSIHLLPFVAALPQTADYQYRAHAMARQHRAVPLAEAGERLLADFVPFVFGSPASEDAHVSPKWREPVYGYAGSLLFAPALFALFRWKNRTRWFLLGMLVVGMLAGVSAPGVSHVLSKIPLFDIALNQRLVYAAVLALATLAAIGIDLWLREPSPALGMTQLAVFIAFAALLAMLWLPKQSDGLSLPYLRANAMRLLIPLALAAAAFLQPIPARAAAAAFIALLLLQRVPPDDSAFTPTYPASALYPKTPLVDALPKTSAPYRVVGKSSALVPNTSAHYELEDPRGFHGMTFAPLRQSLDLWSRVQPVSFNAVDDLRKPFLSFLNVRFAIDRANDPLPEGWQVRKVSGGGRLLENTRVLGRAFVPRNVTRCCGSDLDALRGVDDYGERAWIGGEIGTTEFVAPAFLENGPGRVDVRRNGTGLDLTATMERPTWIVISETAWDGWRATLDGKRAPLHVANVAFMAMHVPAGTHRIELRYLPRAFVVGAWITLLTILAMIAFPVGQTILSVPAFGREGRRTDRIVCPTLILLVLIATPAFASFPAKRLFVPAAGRVSTGGGEYATDLWITNASSSKATVKIALLESGKSTLEPRFTSVIVAPHATTQIDNVTEALLKRPGILGALLLESDEPIV
ncbi:MAG TPA: YfhO family protein, partial [Thermoanaerobaculia bacterium]